MSFTEDELQSFNIILDQRLSAQRREMERSLDRRLNVFRHDIEQRLIAAQQEIVRNLTLKLTEQQNGLDALLNQKFNTQQAYVAQSINSDVEQRQQQLESTIDRMLAAQLLGIEQLLNQSLAPQPLDNTVMTSNVPAPSLEAIEVQTDLPWEDLLDVIGKAVDERLSTLHASISTTITRLEQYLSVQLRHLQDDFLHARGHVQPSQFNRNETTMQEIIQGIEHLERIVESMQVAMTANSALLSNRLYHHQQLPLERAHPASHNNAAHPDRLDSSLPPKDRASEEQAETEEPQGQNS